MKNTHTPKPLHLPLKLTDSPIQRHSRISIVDAGGCHVADIQVNLEDTSPTYTIEERQQYAALIVKAVNCHEPLVKAIEKVAKILDAQDDPRYSIHHPLVKPLLEALALAKAGAA
jgi:hypothetical protein